jgi:hypothetical protein
MDTNKHQFPEQKTTDFANDTDGGKHSLRRSLGIRHLLFVIPGYQLPAIGYQLFFVRWDFG